MENVKRFLKGNVYVMWLLEYGLIAVAICAAIIAVMDTIR